MGEIVSAFSHALLNVSDFTRSKDFYAKVLAPLGICEADSCDGEYVRLTNGHNLVIVLCPTEDKYNEYYYHRKGTGLGHFAISVSSKEIVDKFEIHLKGLGIKTLGEGKTELGYRKGYYCLLFEDPDRIMIEIVCHDPHYFSFGTP